MDIAEIDYTTDSPKNVEESKKRHPIINWFSDNIEDIAFSSIIAAVVSLSIYGGVYFFKNYNKYQGERVVHSVPIDKYNIKYVIENRKLAPDRGRIDLLEENGRIIFTARSLEESLHLNFYISTPTPTNSEDKTLEHKVNQ